MGTAEFAVPSLNALVGAGYEVALVVTQAARPSGRGRRVTQPPVARAAAALELPLFQPDRIRRPDAVEAVRNAAPNIIVVAAYGQILPRSILAIPERGCINVHASLLPRHRGASPISAAILAGDPETGVTIMLMDEGMDTGPILAQTAVPIDDRDDQASLTRKLADVGAELLIEWLPRWSAGQITPQAQDPSRATLTRPIERSDGRLDWSQPAVDLWRRIRAYAQWPQGHTWWDGKLMRIASADYDPDPYVDPGLVVPWGPARRIPTMAAIGTGRGVLLPKTIVLEGRRPMGIDVFIQGHPTFIGSRLRTDSSE